MQNDNNNSFKVTRIPYFDFNSNLPTTYTDALSWYEDLIQLYKKINEIIEWINDYENEYKEYVDKAIKELRDELKEDNRLLGERIDELKIYVDEQDADLESRVMSHINSEIIRVIEMIENQVKRLEKLIHDGDARVQAWSQHEIDKIYHYIDSSFCRNVKTYNPTTGLIEPVCKVINNVYDVLRYLGINVYDFDRLELTAQQYDDLGITAIEFDAYSKYIFKMVHELYMSSPFTGQRVHYKDVIYRLFDLHRESPITVQEYDDLRLTAEDYESKQITAYDYDNNGKNILIA